jgi:nitroreductase
VCIRGPCIPDIIRIAPDRFSLHSLSSPAMKFSVSEITELIRHRRTIYPKDYTDRVVHRELVERILTNATYAPSHGMTQPWRFTVYSGAARETLSTFLGEEYRLSTPEEKFLQRKYDNLTQRPLQSSVVIALGMVRDPNGKISERDELLAMACAVQNMHLTCAAYGLGAFWATGGPMTGNAMRDFIGLGAQDQALGLFFIGYPAIEWPKGYRRPLDQLVTWKSEE